MVTIYLRYNTQRARAAERQTMSYHSKNLAMAVVINVGAVIQIQGYFGMQTSCKCLKDNYILESQSILS